MDLCSIISRHPKEIKSLNVEKILRHGVTKFTDHFIRLGFFEKARDVYEEALDAVSTVRDFSLVFDAYSKFVEQLVTATMEKEEGADDEDIGTYISTNSEKKQKEKCWILLPKEAGINSRGTS